MDNRANFLQFSRDHETTGGKIIRKGTIVGKGVRGAGSTNWFPVYSVAGQPSQLLTEENMSKFKLSDGSPVGGNEVGRDEQIELSPDEVSSATIEISDQELVGLIQQAVLTGRRS